MTSSSSNSPIYRRILLKLSGEALMGEGSATFDPAVLLRMADEDKALLDNGVQVGLVIGGGNIIRGARLAESGIDRVTGDYMGMLGTVINGLAMQDALLSRGVPATVLSALGPEPVCERYVPRRARQLLADGHVAIMSAGTGNPYFTTDSAAALRGIEIEADAVLKATKVDGVFSDDPEKNPDAERFARLSYDEVLDRRLRVMDTTAFVLCRDHGMTLRVFDMGKPGALGRVVGGLDEGTIIE
jgi:uridylate kinase